MEFMGYVRPDGKAGIRNYLLVFAAGRGVQNLAAMIARSIRGARLYLAPNENGRSAGDRATITRTMTGLAKNPNVGGVLVVSLKEDGGYPEFTYDGIIGEIERSGKPVVPVIVKREGGFYQALGEGVRRGRELARIISRSRREPCDFGKLFIACKCGYSDASSGMAGNPVVGCLFDRLVDAGGTAMFSETTEVIGAEHILAKRFVSDAERQKFLDAVRQVENDALSVGQDIRTINPIPANIQAGLTTLEEKSLGAIAKAGHRPLMECVRYGEIPRSKGLIYMDSWMSSSALFAGFAAAGATLTIFQIGAGAMPHDFPAPTANTGVVAPTMFATGNPRAWENGKDELDFNSSAVITEKRSVEEVGEEMARFVCDIASGTLTQGETLNVWENIEMYMRTPGM